MNVIVIVVVVMNVIKGYIYRHWIINDRGIEKSYIGKTKKTIEHRSRNNGKGYLYHDTLFARAIKKYGWDNFHHDIIGVIECETEDELCIDRDIQSSFCMYGAADSGNHCRKYDETDLSDPEYGRYFVRNYGDTGGKNR